eukprot:Skav224756  [mRNA]  locus=scaffold4210:32575:33656:- [translate_table: standard]
MALAAPRWRRHLVFSTSTAALKSYEHRLNEDAYAKVTLFRFSENDELDGDKLTQRLDEDAEYCQASVLLLLTGAASYLWLDPEHHPRNVELCTMLKNRFPQLNFVICPTSPAAQQEWEAHPQQLRPIFGKFFNGNNVTTWDGFDSDAVSSSEICNLIGKKQVDANDISKGGKGNKERRPCEQRFSRWAVLAIGVVLAISTLSIYPRHEPKAENENLGRALRKAGVGKERRAVHGTKNVSILDEIREFHTRETDRDHPRAMMASPRHVQNEARRKAMSSNDDMLWHW